METFFEYPQDHLRFDLTEETTLVSDTVRISIPVNAIVQKDQTEDQLRAAIKRTLQSFIATDWTFGAIQRQEIQTGVERCSLVATCRVSERENYSLRERARQASVPSAIDLGAPAPDYSMSNTQLEEGQEQLRLKILKRAKEHCRALSEIAERDFRISRVTFGAQTTMAANRQMNAMYASSVPTGGSAGSEDLSHSTKLVLTASVKLSHAFLEA